MPKYLAEFDEDSISKTSENLSRLSGRVPGIAPRDIAGDSTSTLPMIFGVNSKVLLSAVLYLTRFYEKCDRDLKWTRSRWISVIKNFKH